MSVDIQHVCQLLLQALIELQGGVVSEASAQAVSQPQAVTSPPPKQKIDRSKHPSNIYARNKEKIRDAIFDIQRDDDPNAPPRTTEEVHTLMIKNGHIDLFEYADAKRQMAQLNRVKSIYSVHFGTKGESPGVFQILLPLKKRNAPKLVPGAPGAA